MQNQNSQRKSWLLRHGDVILYFTYIVSFLLMTFIFILFCYFWIITAGAIDGYRELHLMYRTEYPTTLLCFFGAANAIVLFRVFGLNLITSIAHGLILVVVMIMLVLQAFFYDKSRHRHFTELYLFPTFFLIALYVLQIVLAFHIVVFRPGRTLREQDQRSGIHAFIGVIIFIHQLWNVTLHISMICEHHPKMNYLMLEPSLITVFMYIYVLLILFIILTPYFESENRTSLDVAVDRKQYKKNVRRKRKRRRRSSSPRKSVG